MKQKLVVPPLTEATRLDKFLVSSLTNLSRSFIQQAIKQGKILVNKNRVTVHRWLKEKDEVTVDVMEPMTPQILPNAQVKFKIISAAADYLVIEKPDGLVVHPAAGVNEPTLVDGLLASYPEIKQIGADPLRPGIVHRLDRDVSGLMVVARTTEMFSHLKQQFQQRSIYKEYTGLVTGHVAPPSGRIDFPLARSKTKQGKIAARPQGEEGHEAITEFTVVKRWPHVTLLTISILTGRTHQIRAHLAAFGHPLVGDKIYHPAKNKADKKLGRLFLHASKLSFIDLTDKLQTFTSELPKPLALYLTALK